MGTDLIVLARTDALSAKLIDSNCDPVDHPYILGRCSDGKERTFPNAGIEAIKTQFTGAKVQEVSKLWLSKCFELSLTQAQ